MTKVKKIDVVALVVTYNRKELLIECINALLKQKIPLEKIVVVDNNSDDGTDKLFSSGHFSKNSEIDYVRLKENIGGAGGFSKGIKYLDNNYSYDWLWLMDDDTIAQGDTLENLLADLEKIKEKENISFLASSVVGPENEPMNVPDISDRKTKNGYKNWHRHLSSGLVEIRQATFVSLLISYKAIKKVGYPVASYFIWGDDTEYTLRLTSYYGPAFLSGNSKILHKRVNAKSLSILEEKNPNRIKMYKFFYRNNLLNFKTYFSRRYFLKKYLGYLVYSFYLLIKPGVKFRFKKFRAVQAGWWNYTLKKYNKKEFDKRLEAAYES